MNINKARGFTLLELMVVVAIVGILAAIAYPAYNESVVKGRRAQGRTALAELMQQQERYMTQQNTYLTFNTGQAGTPFKVFSGDTLSQAHYTLGAEACPGTGGDLKLNECIRLVATPKVPDTAAGNLRITSTGTKDCTGPAALTSPKVCWP